VRHHLVMESVRAQMLVAGAGVAGVVFRQAVVLIADHDDNGALGFVLNRPSQTSIADAAPVLSSLPVSDGRIYIGGPVQPDAVAVLAQFDEPEVASQLIFDSVGFVSADAPPNVRGAVKRAKVVAGYAGWAAGQLDAELEAGGWIIEPPRVDDVFYEEPERLWRDVLRRKGPQFRLLSTMPFDPRTN
jgi:putative transcriptional regulator